MAHSRIGWVLLLIAAAACSGTSQARAPKTIRHTGLLHPVPASVTAQCSALQPASSVPVLCPARLVLPPHGVHPRLHVLSAQIPPDGRDRYSIDYSYGAPGSSGSPTSTPQQFLHLVLGGGRPPLDIPLLGTSATRMLGRRTLGGHRGTLWLGRPWPRGGYLGGHLTFVWSGATGLRYFASVHSWRSRPQTLRTLGQIVRSLRPAPRRTDVRLYLRALDRLEGIDVVDVHTGRVSRTRLPHLAGGDPPYGITAAGRRLVYYGRTNTYAVGPSLRAPVDLGRSSMFVPAASPNRVWLAGAGLAPPREVTLSGRVVTATRRRAQSINLIAATSTGPVYQTGSHLVVRGARSGGIVRTLPGPFAVATHGDLIAWCNKRCPALRITNLESDHTQAVRPPIGAHFNETYAGAFSPDGRLVATEATDARGRLRAALVDLHTHRAFLVPGPPASAWFSAGWDPYGRALYYVTPGRRIAAYSPASDRGWLLAARIAEPVLQLVALDAASPPS